MSFQSDDATLVDYVPLVQEPHDDGRTPLALAAGLVAALVAGGAWAALVFLTDREIGFVAWGVGLLVGFAMSRVTVRRSRQLAMAAALFAVLGLAAGKLFIWAGSAESLAQEFEKNEEVMTSSVAWQMYAARELDGATLQAVDAAEASGDTLSDALWAGMQQQGAARLAQMNEEEKHAVALDVSRGMLRSMGMFGGIRAQLSGFDLLWLFLAVSTAFGMLAPPKGQTAPEPTVSV